MRFSRVTYILPVLLAAPLLGGCVVSVAKAVVTAPFKVAGAVIDAATTSQAEADRNRGREMRKDEDEQRKWEKKQRKRLAKERKDRD